MIIVSKGLYESIYIGDQETEREEKKSHPIPIPITILSQFCSFIAIHFMTFFKFLCEKKPKSHFRNI